MSFQSLTNSALRAGINTFGLDVTYTPISGAPVEIKGIFRYEWLEVEGVSSRKPTLEIILEDLESAPSKSDQVTINSVDYKVVGSQPDSFGAAILILQKA